MASNEPTVMAPEIARCPPTPYAIAVAIEATERIETKKIRLSRAISIPISATRLALLLKPRLSAPLFPYRRTRSAPETLKR